jgi:GT2 family glycosyltransferase
VIGSRRALEGAMVDCGAAERTAWQSFVLLLRWLRRGQFLANLRAWVRLRCAAQRLRASAGFDASWYRAAYADVAAARVDPAVHYLRRGAAEGRAPLPVANPPPPRLALTGEGYSAWVAAHDTPGAEQLAAVRVAIERLAWRPVVGVVVFGGDRVAEAMTLASLEAQLYPDWCLTDVPCGDVMLFLPAGTTLATTALFRVAAEVAAAPSVELVYADEDRIDAAGVRVAPWFKPAWDPVLLAECDLIGITGAYRRRLLDRLGVARVTDRVALRKVAQRAVDVVTADAVRHVPAVLFHGQDGAGIACPPSWPGLSRPSAPRPRCADGRDKPGHDGSTRIAGDVPLVSIIVPTRDRAALLARCVEGVLHRTDYESIELLIMDNDSRERRTARLLTRLAADPRVRILPHPGPFNWSAMNNAGVRHARGEIIVLLNNDIDVINPAWLHEMVVLAQQPDIGIVGARLLYPDGALQHAGVTIGPGAVAAHLCRGAARYDPGHGGMLRQTRSVAAVTGACMALRRAVFEAVGGLEAEHLAVTNNDLDLCLRARARGWRVVCTPRAELYHRESASRGVGESGEQLGRVQRERAYLLRRWGALAERDPTLNLNLSTVNGQLVLVAPVASPGGVIGRKISGDALDVGQEVGRQTGWRKRGAAGVQRVGQAAETLLDRRRDVGVGADRGEQGHHVV